MSATVINIEDEVTGVQDGFRYEILEEKHWPAVLEHTQKFFFREEPMMRSLGCTEDMQKGCVRWIKDGLEKGKHLSLVAFCEQTGQLAGVRVTKMVYKDQPVQLPDGAVRGPERMKLVRTVMELNEAAGDLFAVYGVTTIQEFQLVSVDPAFRGRGLGRELILRSMRLGKRFGAEVCKGVFTSIYSQRISADLGFYTKAEFWYKDYCQDGELVFTNVGPHTNASLQTRVI